MEIIESSSTRKGAITLLKLMQLLFTLSLLSLDSQSWQIAFFETSVVN